MPQNADDIPDEAEGSSDTASQAVLGVFQSVIPLFDDALLEFIKPGLDGGIAVCLHEIFLSVSKLKKDG